MSAKPTYLTDHLYDYLLHQSIRECPILKELQAETATMTGAQMQVSPDQGQFLTLLVKMLQARKAIELGVFTGYSSICIARGLHPSGMLLACDVSDETTKVAQRYWERAHLSDKIKLKIAPAETTLKALLENGEQDSFDFVFIDADKQNYEIYYELSLALLRPGGLIVLDNMLWHGRVADLEDQSAQTKTLRNLTEKIRDDHRVDPSLLSVADGLLLAIKR